ncbi:hypothetical protein ACLB2K_055036 [Fragaria x ananassa]
MPVLTGLSGSDLEVGLVDFIRGEGTRWLSGSNQKASSSIRRHRRRADGVEVESEHVKVKSEHVKVKSEDVEVEAELVVVVDGIRRSRGVNVKLATSRSRRRRRPATSRPRSRSRRHLSRRRSRSTPELSAMTNEMRDIEMVFCEP